VLVAAALALAFPFMVNAYWLSVGVLAMFYAIVAASWALLAGYAGQFSFGHMAFVSLGAYTSGLLVMTFGVPIPFGMVAGVLMCAIVGSGIGFVCLRMRGPYLALFTVAFSEVLRIVIVSENEVTGGSGGLEVTPLFHGRTDAPYYYLGLILLVASLAIMLFLVTSRWGLFFRAIRENEDAAAAAGVKVVRFRILAFAITSSFAGLAGGFYGHYIGILTPDIGSVDQMGLVVAMAVIGGSDDRRARSGVPGRGAAQLRPVATCAFRCAAAADHAFCAQRTAGAGVATVQRNSSPPPAGCGWGEGTVGHWHRLLPPTPYRKRRGSLIATTMSPLIEACDLTKRFGGIVAVSGLNLAVRHGELVGLIGPNGSGKTTAINMLTGHLAPAGGHIFLRGTRADGHSPSEFAAWRVGRTFQITQLFSRMTVLENMLVPGLARPHSHKVAVTRTARRHLEFLGLAALETLQAKNLSGGQQKLLELGRALMLDPEILFLDEPFAGVNPFLRDRIIELVRTLHADGRTFVIVDHDIEALQRLVQRMVVMSRGEKIADGTVAEVREDQEVLRAYAGV
jgi:branched-chain amino acid transport system permease protein